jgi:hypothetical protein
MLSLPKAFISYVRAVTRAWKKLGMAGDCGLYLGEW